jgi:hypothetical protein
MSPPFMPSISRKQQKFFFSELAKKKKGQKTKTGLSKKKLEEFTKLKRKK